MPKKERDRTNLAVMQAWFDDTGKDGTRAVFVLAGLVAPVKNWAAASDEWQAVLDRPPRLQYFKAYEAYGFRKQFRGWSESARDKKLDELIAIIEKYAPPHRGGGSTFSIQYDDWDSIISIALSKEHPELRRFKNPYYMAFIGTIGAMLHEAYERPTIETLHLLFDEGIERDPSSLKEGYRDFVQFINQIHPEHVALLHNKEAEFRDDKKDRPLQASDLFAWHVRKDLEARLRGENYDHPHWMRMKTALAIRDYSFGRQDLINMLHDALKEQQAKLGEPGDLEALDAAIEKLRNS